QIRNYPVPGLGREAVGRGDTGRDEGGQFVLVLLVAAVLAGLRLEEALPIGDLVRHVEALKIGNVSGHDYSSSSVVTRRTEMNGDFSPLSMMKRAAYSSPHLRAFTIFLKASMLGVIEQNSSFGTPMRWSATAFGLR